MLVIKKYESIFVCNVYYLDLKPSFVWAPHEYIIHKINQHYLKQMHLLDLRLDLRLDFRFKNGRGNRVHYKKKGI